MDAQPHSEERGDGIWRDELLCFGLRAYPRVVQGEDKALRLSCDGDLFNSERLSSIRIELAAVVI